MRIDKPRLAKKRRPERAVYRKSAGCSVRLTNGDYATPFFLFQNPKIRNLFEFHVADLKLPSQGSMNLSSCCLPGTWIPPDLCSAQCRILLEVDLQPAGKMPNATTVTSTTTSTTAKASVFRTGVVFTNGKLYNSTLDFCINLYAKMEASEQLPFRSTISSVFSTLLSLPQPSTDAILLTRLQPLLIKGRPRNVWTTQTLQSAAEPNPHIRLTLSYRFACPPDYYGEACERYCSPRDSLLGHYKCDPKDGRIVCLPGWRGSQCNEALCKNGCLHGTCDSPGVCKCREGWEGEACNHCIPFPGCGHGTCKFNWTLGQHEPFTCECQPGWSGMLCTVDTQFCSNHPDTCLNDGVCHNTPTETSPGYACQCPLGYEGYHCETSNQDCRVHRCSGHGICQTNGNCACFDGFYGSNCQFDQTECWQNPCQGNNSVCIPVKNTSESDLQSTKVAINFRCECQPGLSGMNCERKIRRCDARPCLHGGKCVELAQDSDGYQCVCLSGYRGRHCELNDSVCQHLPCANGGQCVDRAHHVECRCPLGWTGPTCRQNVNECTTPICKNGAACRDRPGTYECLCTPGWTGRNCNVPVHNATLVTFSSSSSSPPPPSSPTCTSACGEEDNEIIWPNTFVIIRCAVVASIIVLVSLLIFTSLLFLRRRKIWWHKKSLFEELQRPVPPTQPGSVYWNSSAMPEPLLICTSGDTLTRHKTLFSEAPKTIAPGKERLCAGKPLIYDLAAPSPMITSQHIVPLCGPSVHHHAIVYACQTPPPPPYEDLVQGKVETGKKDSSQS
ncbi:Delta-like protein [Echinococcus granulosus]|uniref:Delta-like protein n=1 Tax=Echinococcus granulosus TaxID=6210 RepID=W6US92_ECHGR|nr:Delta-like protein [Echinococcus granulosus]EUB61232.1 Delta-like protein [Echinococcus granulosus]